MKLNKLSIYIALLLLIGTTHLFAVDAVVRRIEGKVEVKPENGTWTAAETGQRVSRNSFISTGFNSKAVLELGGATLEVRALTRMQLERIVETNESVDTDLFLEVGKVKAEVKSTEGLGNNFKLRSPVSTAAVRGTTFIFDGYTLWVTEGTVVFHNRIGQPRRVSAGQESTTDGVSPPSDSQFALLNEQFEVVTNLSGDEASFVSDTDSLLEDQAQVFLNFVWE
ncbi:MAG: FecR family protein [Spirochaetota bacterium]